MSADPPRVYRVTRPRARTPHLCIECRALIHVGEQHVHLRGLWDEWMSFRWCLACDELRERVEEEYQHDPYNLPAFGDLLEFVNELAGA